MMKFFTSVCMAAMAFTATAADVAPAAPSNLDLSMGQDMEVVLNWTLPTAYTDGTAFAEGTAVSAVKVFRGNKEIALLDGAVTTYTDPMESDSHPSGHGYGMNVYEVSACVDNVWSATCLPARITVGEATMLTGLPWEPKLEGLGAEQFGTVWRSYDGGWAPAENGVAFAPDGVAAACGWLVGPMTGALDLLPRRHYVAEFKVESDANVLYSVGLVQSSSPAADAPMAFMQVIAGNCLATDNASVQQVEFVYEPKQGGETFWPQSVLFAVNACTPAGSGSVNLELSYLKISPVGEASVADMPAAGAVSDIEVYNLQGVLLGGASSLDLQGYAPGLYAVRYRCGSAVRSEKILVR